MTGKAIKPWTLACLLLSSTPSPAQESKPAAFRPHDFVPVELSYTSLGDATRYRLNALGIGAGHTLLDLHSSMPLLSPIVFDQGPLHLPVLGLTASVSSLFVAWASNNVESEFLRYLAMPIVLFPYVLNPELRLMPLWPASAYAGYSFDLLDGDRFHPLQAFRYGLMGTWKYARLKLGAEHTLYRGEPYFAYAAAVAVVLGDIEGAMGR